MEEQRFTQVRIFVLLDLLDKFNPFVGLFIYVSGLLEVGASKRPGASSPPTVKAFFLYY